MIKPDYLNGWTYHPEFTTADTSSLEPTIYINDSAIAIADAIDRRIRHIYNDKEANMVGIKFNDLEKELNAREKLTPVHPVGPKPIPKKVIFSGPATTILWKDGTKTTVKCQEGDEWTPDVGIAMCYLKKMLGNKGNYNKIFREAEKVSEVQYKKEDLKATKAINISEINACVKNAMKDAEATLDKMLGGKK